MSSASADVSAITRVENAGLDVISESDRRGRSSDLFMLWLAANTPVLELSWSAWVLGFRLSFWQAIVARSVGTIVSLLLCSVVAVLGKRGSTPTLALSRAAFGYNGNCLSAALSWILTVGWKTVLCVSATLVSAMVFQTLGWHNQVGVQILGFLLTVDLTVNVGIPGFEAIMRVQTWVTWATGVLTIIYLVLVTPQVSIHRTLASPSGGPVVFIRAPVMVVIGFSLGRVNAAADYSRHLPRKASTVGVTGWITLGSALPCVALVFFGIFLVGSDAELGQTINTGPIGALTTILPTQFPTPFAIVAILGLAGGIIMDLYFSDLSLLVTGLPMRQYMATSTDAITVTVGIITVIFGADDPLGPFQGSLTTPGVVTVAWVGVMVAEVILRRHGYGEEAPFMPGGVYGSVNREAITFVAVGSVVGWGLIVDSAASWLSWQGYLLGPLGGRDEARAGASLGMLAALLIGVLGYLALG